MKSFILLSGFFLFVNFNYSQSLQPIVQQKLQNKFCECLSVSIDIKTGIDDKKFEECWKNDSVFQKQLEDSFTTNDSLISEEKFYTWGKEFFENNQVKFIIECDAWYHFIDSARYNFLSELDTIVQLKKIDTLTQFIIKHGDQSDLYRQRGMAYFSVSKFDNAKKDFDKALSLPGASSQNLYFRGWIAELKGNYDEALADYKLARKTSGIVYIDNLIGIAERKKKENKK